MISITKFPLPPSTNTHLIPVMNKIKWRNGKPSAVGRMVKSDAHRKYEAECYAWSLKYQKSLAALRAEINQERIKTESTGQVFALKVEAYVCLKRERVLTEDNKPQQVDSSNFLKSLEDNLFKILGIDDRFVFPISIEKVWIDDGSEECSVIKITKAKIRSKSDIMRIIGGQTA